MKKERKDFEKSDRINFIPRQIPAPAVMTNNIQLTIQIKFKEKYFFRIYCKVLNRYFADL